MDVHRIPLSGAHAPPDVTVVDASAPGDVLERLARAPAPLAPGRALVALVTLGEVNSPDVVDPVRVARRGRVVAVDVVVLRFHGIVGGNVRAWAILEVPLGALVTGSYELDVTQRVFAYTDLDRPFAQTPLPATRLSHTFVVG